jgi:hypothetical protein
MPVRVVGLTAGKQLVPCAGARPRPFHNEGKRIAPSEVRPRLDLRHQRSEFVLEQRLRRAGAVECIEHRLHRAGASARAHERRRDQCAPFQQFDLDGNARLLLDQAVAPPGGEDGCPGLDRIDVAAEFVRGEDGAPAIIVVERHGDGLPGGVVLPPPAQGGGDHLMPVAEYVRHHLDRFADDPLEREAAAVDPGIDGLDEKGAAGDARPIGRRIHSGVRRLFLEDGRGSRTDWSFRPGSAGRRFFRIHVVAVRMGRNEVVTASAKFGISQARSCYLAFPRRRQGRRKH